MNLDNWTLAAYLAAAIFFILGLKKLSSPRSAVQGNFLSALGMLIGVLATLIDNGAVGLGLIFGGIALGAVIGVVSATNVKMAAMPELVALFNGFGGGASMLVAATSHIEAAEASYAESVATIAATIVGAVTLTGSLIAFTKLRGKLRSGRIIGPRWVSGMLALTAAGIGTMIVVYDDNTFFGSNALWLLVMISALLGVVAVLPIGGADMPVVIATLNSLSGVAAVAAGFVLENQLLIIAGALVGASGLLLTQIMCESMNRPLAVVLFGLAPSSETIDSNAGAYDSRIRPTSAEDVSLLLETARRVVIVPGYGLAVAQAQHAVHDLAGRLNSMGIEVVFGIHPVAGRMPGHMNVLLAEAKISYELLLTMEEVNPLFEQTDVTIVLGANDVVNPTARSDASSPIAGMPILDVDRSSIVIVIKRSLSPGFAGIPNPLFTADNTLMLFEDGREAVTRILQSLRQSKPSLNKLT
ncbi:MAG: NAD(P)(+) transhydrogenase (Re/Si-specific) subunit beta [Acidimicrobiaceae bacterium]|nr:NAD(P)(+) transhydrogenase (Re/Si-specific) subunit beta [Acidimicrobiaceae bacterium]